MAKASSKRSAGILLYRIRNDKPEVFLVHPGGPFWKKKDAGAWSIPKGEYTIGEEPIDAAKREFNEETGIELEGNFLVLSPVKLKSGKVIDAWAVEQDVDPAEIKSNFFDMEWPPKSGKMQSFPEVDSAAWFSVEEAMEKINEAQKKFIEELIKKLKS